MRARRRLTRLMRPSESWYLEYPYSLELASNIFVFGPLKGAIRGLIFYLRGGKKMRCIHNCARNPKHFLIYRKYKIGCNLDQLYWKTGDQVEKWHASFYVTLVIYVVWNNAHISWLTFVEYISRYDVLLRRWMTHHLIFSKVHYFIFACRSFSIVLATKPKLSVLPIW
jgi:hypothetical protein